MKFHPFILFVALSIIAFPIAARDTFCRSTEETLFSCALENGKTISLCADNLSKPTSSPVAIHYFYGLLAAGPEFAYPPANLSNGRFKAYEQYSAKTGVGDIVFDVGNTEFSIYRTSSVYGFNGGGLFVSTAGRAIAKHSCINFKSIVFNLDFYEPAKLGLPQIPYMNPPLFVGPEQP